AAARRGAREREGPSRRRGLQLALARDAGEPARGVPRPDGSAGGARGGRRRRDRRPGRLIGSTVLTAESTAARTPAPARRKGAGVGERALAKIFLTPSFAFMALIALFPVIYAIVMSLYQITGFRREFIGGGNFGQLLSDSGFYNAVGNTFLFTVVSVAFEFAIGLMFALIMNQAFFGRGVTRAIILVPWVIPTSVAAQVWRYMFDQNPGFINSVLGTNINWLN